MAIQPGNDAETMSGWNDQTIAMEICAASRNCIRNYAWALSEAVTPQVRDVLKRHFDAAVQAHADITNHMLKKGYYQPYNAQQQFAADINNAERTLDTRS